MTSVVANRVSIAVDSNGLVGLLFSGIHSTYPANTNVNFLLWDGSAWNTVQSVSTENTS